MKTKKYMDPRIKSEDEGGWNLGSVFFVLLLSSIPMVARYHVVSRDKVFDDLINKYEYAVVCFAPSRVDSKEVDRDEKKEIVSEFRDLKKKLRSASDAESYKKYLQQEVGFLLVDTASGKVKELDEEFALDNMPSCLLFEQGQVIFAGKYDYAQIFEPVSKYSIISFLEKYFKYDFDAIVKDKKEEENQARQERIASYSSYVYSGYPYSCFSCGYGYGGYPYYGRFGGGYASGFGNYGGYGNRGGFYGGGFIGYSYGY